ncbi:Delta(14)-sterol reductase [Uncinocarpus reesii 1704]|uniref:Delta(14)-sterol reductase n=1 Tax=Uncinocarpus reesii (strain UAMH 1704) TaxID=336963 RepID=C4JS97_UNCRE|nr:Delta(14)-sterol reductase [Uncinocarpus reesii 1704]EEP80494.1 Delta(14)-sterol reductase [Uncinocarpus reesii 1704]
MPHKYEFGGPVGAAGIVFGLPPLMYFLYFTCNDISGCPAPALRDPANLTWEKLKAQIPWPGSVSQFASWEVTGWVLAYYLFSLLLYRILPAQEIYGTKLRESGRPLKYRFNAFYSTIVHLVLAGIGTYIYGADFVVWRYITDNYLQILTANVLLAYAISIYVYAGSFGVKPGNSELRELAIGGQSGNVLYDFFIGRELNPRKTLPFFGEVDIKAWLEMRPGLTGWALLDLAFVAKQYRTYGYVSDSIVFICCIQTYYVLEGQYAESGLLGMMDIITDGLGFMLTFGDIIWVPFLYSTQCRYLSVYPVHLGWAGLAAVSITFAIGVSIFRAANSQKYTFRTKPDHPSVAGMSYIQTKRGTRLLTAGWWGMARHINYFGDWLQSLPFCLPTALAGYLIFPAGSSIADAAKTLDGREVLATKGAGMFYTYFYSAWFAFMLIHREQRDDAACSQKYGEDWERYKKLVKWRILPGVY